MSRNWGTTLHRGMAHVLPIFIVHNLDQLPENIWKVTTTKFWGYIDLQKELAIFQPFSIWVELASCQPSVEDPRRSYGRLRGISCTGQIMSVASKYQNAWVWNPSREKWSIKTTNNPTISQPQKDKQKDSNNARHQQFFFSISSLLIFIFVNNFFNVITTLLIFILPETFSRSYSSVTELSWSVRTLIWEG